MTLTIPDLVERPDLCDTMPQRVQIGPNLVPSSCHTLMVPKFRLHLVVPREPQCVDVAMSLGLAPPSARGQTVIFARTSRVCWVPSFRQVYALDFMLCGNALPRPSF